MIFQGRVDIQIETELTQVKGDVHILFPQLHIPLDPGATSKGTKGVEIGTIEVQFQNSFPPRAPSPYPCGRWASKVA